MRHFCCLFFFEFIHLNKLKLQQNGINTKFYTKLLNKVYNVFSLKNQKNKFEKKNKTRKNNKENEKKKEKNKQNKTKQKTKKKRKKEKIIKKHRKIRRRKINPPHFSGWFFTCTLPVSMSKICLAPIFELLKEISFSMLLTWHTSAMRLSKFMSRFSVDL